MEFVGYTIHCNVCHRHFHVAPDKFDPKQPGMLECPHCHAKDQVIVK